MQSVLPDLCLTADDNFSLAKYLSFTGLHIRRTSQSQSSTPDSLWLLLKFAWKRKKCRISWTNREILDIIAASLNVIKLDEIPHWETGPAKNWKLHPRCNHSIKIVLRRLTVPGYQLKYITELCYLTWGTYGYISLFPLRAQVSSLPKPFQYAA